MESAGLTWTTVPEPRPLGGLTCHGPLGLELGEGHMVLGSLVSFAQRRPGRWGPRALEGTDVARGTASAGLGQALRPDCALGSATSLILGKTRHIKCAASLPTFKFKLWHRPAGRHQTSLSMCLSFPICSVGIIIIIPHRFVLNIKCFQPRSAFPQQQGPRMLIYQVFVHLSIPLFQSQSMVVSFK